MKNDGWESKPRIKPEEIKGIIEPIRRIDRKVRVNKSGKNQLIRIPVEVTTALNIKAGDYFVFDIELPTGNEKGKKPKLNCYIQKDGPRKKM